jgi:CheY-like chemotaxis protein
MVPSGLMTRRILVCDNEEALRDLVRASLSRDGYEIEEARDGDEALSLARRLRPDLIVLDVMMPGRSGLDVLGQLRSDSELVDVKVVVLTARAQSADRSSAERAGANAFLSKPFSPLELEALVERLLDGE